LYEADISSDPLATIPTGTTTNDVDVNKLSDDEVRERFKNMMVCISFFSLMIFSILNI
jgi:hypothetical protein